ncbi:MAG: HRDC domain-containing protein [Syntrophotaleaceae bacterium]
MQWKFYRIPVNNCDSAEEEFNRFLRGQRVLAVHREFVAQGESSYWALAVEYLPGEKGSAGTRETKRKQRVDYRELLSQQEFVRFAKLREWRKTVAQEEAVPVYTILTNEQLAEIARNACRTLKQLAAIAGIGPGRLEKYGKGILSLMQEGLDEEDRQPLSEDR